MTFDEWFEENREELEALLRSDQEELLFRAWMAGYDQGAKRIASFAAELFKDIR